MISVFHIVLCYRSGIINFLQELFEYNHNFFIWNKMPAIGPAWFLHISSQLDFF